MHATLTDQVYDHVVRQLLSRRLRPGDLVDRKSIAKELKVSLIPVSDAVLKLTHEGFLTTRRRKGTFVQSPSIEDVRGQFLLREAIECQCARLYCGRRLNAVKSRLTGLAKNVDRVTALGLSNCKEDFAFHLAMVELTECDPLIRCFKQVVHLSLFHEVALISPPHLESYDNHVALLEDLCQADPDQAEARIRRSNRMGKESFLKGVEI